MTIITRILLGMRSLLVLAGLSASLCSHAAFATGNEGVTPDAEARAQQEIAQETSRYVLAGDFERLEALHIRLNRPGERTPSGIWKLAIYYNQLRSFRTQVPDMNDWLEMQGQANQWQARYPDSVPARLLDVYVKLELLEITRAGRPLGKLKVVERRILDAYAIKAMQMLEDTRRLAVQANDPEWHRAMLNVAPYMRNMSANGYRAKVREALARHPDYHEAYFTAALYSQPRWGGTRDGVARLALDASHAGSKESPSMYARIFWAMDQRAYQGRLFDAGGADWPSMRASFEHMVAQYPVAWNLNGFAYFACMAKDYKTMDAIVERIGPGLVPALWGAGGQATHARCLAHQAPAAARP
ncbi:hypothetical protein [Massilia sp. CCM 8734]|uniref:hypothetical protein n=1 Tax=Massilia sp. CCM 8734 TaxID=2609283 RepID=UPI001422E2AA|nr:hypothetical protein [Massilia sp. CCM 8734]NHZ98398.1 hypothetical protein [Massilia sp. CCM 8734]